MASDDALPSETAPLTRSPGIPLGAFDVLVKAKGVEVKARVRFFYNYQRSGTVWIEAPPDVQKWPVSTKVEVLSPAALEPFPAAVSGFHMVMQEGVLEACLLLDPLREPIAAPRTDNLKRVSFALLDSPLTGPSEQQKTVLIRCAQFEATIERPSESHLKIAETLGSTPHVLSQSGTLCERTGKRFSSNEAVTALNALHGILSFAAGRWIGVTLVEGFDDSGQCSWFQFGRTRIGEPSGTLGWFDPKHPEWLAGLCDGLLQMQADEQAADVMQRALYWYARSNGTGAGIDGALILTQCALELLSWYVIVRRNRALSEFGYGQLADASERMRLMLSLLGIPPNLPRTLPELTALRKEWGDVAEAVVRARNYLVHPTQSRSGKLTQKKQYPWYELWVAGQWMLELVILRLLGYQGEYQNRTRIRDFQRNEKVPWDR